MSSQSLKFKRKIYLHVGHGKTGTSALQSFIALNRGLLAEYGVNYPEPKTGSFNNAIEGKISSGNASNLKEVRLSDFVNSNVDSLLPSDDAFLFSNEGMWQKLRRDVRDFSLLNENYDLTLIFFIRNPIDYCFSAYGQSVKRGGQEKKFASAISNVNNLDHVCEFIDLCKSEGVDLRVINYSNVSNLEQKFCDVFLGSKCKDFLSKSVMPKAEIVNRSLSRVEYEFQRKFNKYYGANSSRFVSDALVNYAPDIKSEKEFIDNESLEHFIAENQKKVDYVNQFLNKENELVLKKPTDIAPQTDYYEISAQQIDVLAQSISTQLKLTVKNKKASSNILANKDADLLRDIALKYEKNQSLTLEDAHYLMNLAHKVRPKGPVIKKKVAEFELALKSMDK